MQNKLENKDVIEFLPNLWLGNNKSISRKGFLDKFNIQYILNVGELNSITIYPNKKYYELSKNTTDHKTLNGLFDNSCDFICDGLKNGFGVLISATTDELFELSVIILSAFLLRSLHINYLDAISYVNHILQMSLIKDDVLREILDKYHLHVLHNKETGEGTSCGCYGCAFNE